jgi:hypothetical protein
MLLWVVFSGPHDAAEREPRERSAAQHVPATGKCLPAAVRSGGAGKMRAARVPREGRPVAPKLTGRSRKRTRSLRLRDREVTTSSKRKQAIRRLLSFTLRRLKGRCFTLTKEALTRLSRAMARGAKYLISLSRHSSLGTRHWSRLPETAKRVETYVSHRKQTIATCSTRHSSHHTARPPTTTIIQGDSRKSYRAMLPRTVARHSDDTDHRYEKQ